MSDELDLSGLFFMTDSPVPAKELRGGVGADTYMSDMGDVAAARYVLLRSDTQGLLHVPDFGIATVQNIASSVPAKEQEQLLLLDRQVSVRHRCPAFDFLQDGAMGEQTYVPDCGPGRGKQTCQTAERGLSLHPILSDGGGAGIARQQATNSP